MPLAWIFRAVPPSLGAVGAVEVGTVFGVVEVGAVGSRGELDGGERNRDALIVDRHRVAVDDASVGDDVVVDGVESMDRATRRAGRFALATPDAEVEGVLDGTHPLVGSGEPSSLRLEIGERSEHLRRARLVGALEGEG